MLPTLLIVLIFAWAIYGLPAVGIPIPNILKIRITPVFIVNITVGFMGIVGIFVLLRENNLTEFMKAIAPELVGIMVTVLFIERLTKQYTEEQEKKAILVREMGSSRNDIALEAVKELRQQGWLTDGSLRSADLKAANLASGNLRSANMPRVNLSLANLENANLNEANIEEAMLMGASLQMASLSRANLRGAMLAGANLKMANLFDSNLQKASLRGANLQDAFLDAVLLQGTDLSTANLDGVTLIGALYDRYTTFPDGFDPVAAGAIKVD